MELVMESPVSNFKRMLQHTKVWLILWVILNLVGLFKGIYVMTIDTQVGVNALLIGSTQFFVKLVIFIVLTGLYYGIRFKILKKPLGVISAMLFSLPFVLCAPVNMAGLHGAPLQIIDISFFDVVASVVDLVVLVLGLIVPWVFGCKLLGVK